MDYVALLRPTTRIVNAKATNKDRKQHYGHSQTMGSYNKEASNSCLDKDLAAKIGGWEINDRRTGSDRRNTPNTKRARFEARNKTDRRASKLNIQI